MFGLTFVVLAVLTWRGPPERRARRDADVDGADRHDGTRPRRGAQPAADRAERQEPALELKAGALIAEGHLPPSHAAALTALFAVLGGTALIVLAVLAAVPSKRVTAALGVVKEELIQHNAAIMTVLFVLLAGLQISHIVTALTA